MIADLIAKKSIIKHKVITKDDFEKISTLFATLKVEMEAEHADLLVEALYEITIGNQTYSGPSLVDFNNQYQTNYKADNIRLLLQVSNPQEHLNPIISKITLLLDRKLESGLSVVGTNNNWVNGVF